MESQLGSQDDSVSPQSDEWQLEDPKGISETEKEAPRSPSEPFPPQASASTSPEPVSDSMAHGEFEILILP